MTQLTQASNGSNTNHGIIRNKSYFNHVNPVKNTYAKKPDYFVATSTGAIASNPNSLRDMGGPRNVPYRYADVTDDGQAGQVTWKDLASQEATLRKINHQLTAPHTGVRLQQYPEESEVRYKPT